MIPERISKIEVDESNVSRETLISLHEIEPNKSQPRKRFDRIT